jgi:tetratricopeptide (TPR) repeat protein
MLTLTLTQHAESQRDRYCVEVTLEGNGDHLTANAHFDLNVNLQYQEKIRWYLEDFLEYPQDPAPIIAANIEQRMTEIGLELFEKVFHANDDTRQVWEKVRHHISDTRVEIVTGVRDAAAIPWELIRDPQSEMPLALGASAFVRTTPQGVQRSQIAQTVDGKIRILLVICRPGGGNDVPFRSVAIKLIKGLTDSASEVFQLDVLRPPTYSQLECVLRQAKAAGQPYHIVHFDGHGIHEDLNAKDQKKPPRRLRGYLVFENPDYQDKRELVRGDTLGELLTETGVSLLVLNACRSAYVEAPTEPGKTLANSQTSAYGSLAQEVMEAGVPGVVAMRYTVYVVTAAQFVAELYAALAQGQALSQAVNWGRQQLYAQPLREIAYQPQPLQDWLVPMVYEAAPVALLPEPTFNPSQGEAVLVRGRLDGQLPKQPDAGFLGRDETLLALDRAFDTQSIVLLHAYAGSGKTSSSAEFGRWYALTGGVEGRVLFTSFERYMPLARVLDKIGQVFGAALEAAGVHWLALSDEERRDKALEVLRQVSVLWIWDNVEPVAGFPAGKESAWSSAEQQELVDFLRKAQQTQAKFLLTSRRDEQGWLGDLPHRITVPPMPMRERVELARAVAEKYGHQLTEVEDWRPLLRYSQGNPMTITAVVGQALRNGFRTRQQIEEFVFQLRSGEAEIDDDESEGRSKSLGASLSYGFEHAFSEEELQKLALLYFFQGFVNVGALCLMGLPEADWCLPTVRSLTFEAGIDLLDRTAEVGLLTKLTENYYNIHPALPWYFKKLFDQYYPPDENNPTLASRAFVEAIGVLGNYSNNQYEKGNRDTIAPLHLEEANLLYARQLAKINGWWLALTSTMQGLRTLYEYTGRRWEWARLVEEIVPDFFEPATDSPLPGREEEWALLAEYRVQFARERHQWAEAERLHLARIEWARQQASSALAAPPETWNSTQCKAIRTLSSSLHELGQILREQGKPECVAAYEKALALLKQVGDKAGAAICALNLGHASTQIPAIRNLEEAEQLYKQSLQLRDQRDWLGRSKCLIELGRVAHERFQESRTARQPEEELRRHLNNAVQFFHQAINFFPQNAVNHLAVAHNQLGNICRSAGDFDRAFLNYCEAIRYEEAQGNLYGAAQDRFNIALIRVQASRFDEALLYAQTALSNFETFGDRAAVDIQDAQQLIRLIEQSLKARGG